jgi:hypothetical protein
MPKYAVSPPLSGSAGTPYVFGRTEGSPDTSALLGQLNEQGAVRRVLMDVATEHVIAIFGKRGSGKSYTLGVLIESLSTNGASSISTGVPQRGILLLDTLNVFWSLQHSLSEPAFATKFAREVAQLAEWGITPPSMATIVWTPRGYGSPYAVGQVREFAISPSELTADDLADLCEVDPQRDVLGQLLAEARDTTADRKSDFTFADVLETVEEDPDIAAFYADGSRRAARQRLRWLSGMSLFGQGTPFTDLIRPGVASVLQLGTVPNTVRTVLASVLLRRIHVERALISDVEKQLRLNASLADADRARMKDAISKSIPPCWVLIDEAQNILPSNRAVKSTDAVVRFVREGRNFGLSFGLTTQQPSAVDQRILAQADTIICHKLTVAADIARMKENVKCAEPAEVKARGASLDFPAWIRSLDPGTAIVTNTESERVFSVQIRPRVTPHAGVGFSGPEE